MIRQLPILMVALLYAGCTTDNQFARLHERTIVENDFQDRIRILDGTDNNLLNPLYGNHDSSFEFCYKFILAYSPLSDLADYTGEFHEANTSLAIQSRHETNWGSSVPDELFLHYVLPVRVNNENLDSFRIKYSEELFLRVEGLDARQAALEINRWCHEKVTYQLSDIRTSSPVATILSARGRCGEESTLTVSALRAVGLPARQVYTPRWAHCDDNHAWVEVWIDGQWYYMGACEPEGVLDRGWFTEPARRAMLVHTKAFGHYTYNENIIINEKRYSEINNLEKYAYVKTIFVLVTNDSGLPLADIDVEYQLFNYSEFYPLAKVPTGEEGVSSLTTGLGDLLIWAGKDEKFGFTRVSVSDVDTVKIVMNVTPERVIRMKLDLGVPVVPDPLPMPPAEIIKHNLSLVARGDSIRESYVQSWIIREKAVEFALLNGYDIASVPEFILKSQGNYREIMNFLKRNVADRDLAVELLRQISEKDLRDTRELVLNDHLANSKEFLNTVNESLFNNYILNPRIANEMLTDWRGKLKENRIRNLKGNGKNDHLFHPSELARHISEEIMIYNDENHYGVPLTPKGVQSIRISDRQSYDIYLVASFRSNGIPARLEPGTLVPQYWSEGNWLDMSDSVEKYGLRSTISFYSNESLPIPEYFKHFTIARFENGKYHTVNFDYNRRCTDFPDSVALLPGHYMLVTGNRVNDSKILAELSFFSLAEGDHLRIDVSTRKESIKDLNPIK